MIDFDGICTLARQAGAAIMEIYADAGRTALQEKADRSPLTAADSAAHRLIDAGLRRLTPEIPVLSEEGRDIAFQERRSWERFWLVDPLDGTKEFLKRNGEFTVNIALVQAGRPTAGVIFAPALDLLYLGKRGEGARRWRKGRGAEEIRVRNPAAIGLVVVQSRSHPSAELDSFLKTVTVAESLAVGSSLKLCAVAEGRADLYPRFGPTMEWDTGAGQAILEAAGGSVAGLDGSPLSYNKPDLTNGFFIARGASA